MSENHMLRSQLTVDRQRRSLIHGGTAVALTASGIGKLAAPGAQPIRIGHVTSQTSPLAVFGAVDRCVVDARG